MSATVHHGDCLDVMPTLSGVDAIVCDPPYHLTTGKKGGSGSASLNPNSPAGRSVIGTGFMGKHWDGGDVAFRPETWLAALACAKPGAHLVAFGGTRTYHRLTCAIEDAGWEIRDCLSWLYGSGFPKSHNGAWGGTALKPAWEPCILARKPLIGTVEANHAEHGTGALNIDGCRIEGAKAHREKSVNPQENDWAGGGPWKSSASGVGQSLEGRWPANVCLDEDAAALLDEQSGDRPTGARREGVRQGLGYHGAQGDGGPSIAASDGGGSRFFYTAKAARSERDEGLKGFASIRRTDGRGTEIDNPRLRTSPVANHHPTVKPIDLMRWLCRLVTPIGGTILDPFTGSGSTGCAAVLEGFDFIGIEREAEYVDIARARIAHHKTLFVPSLFGGAA